MQAEAELRAEFERIAAAEPIPLSEQDRETIRQMAQDIPALWHASSTSAADRQALMRQLVERVTVTLHGNSEQMQVEVHWAGGNRTRLSLIRPVGSLQQLSYYPELLQRTMELRASGNDIKTIARRLTEEGWRP